jgi:hypothetical protein
MADKSIYMHIDDIIELDYLVKEISESIVTFDKKPGDVSDAYISKNTYIFDPDETGTYQLNINGQTVEIEVTDIPSSAIYHYPISEGSGSAIFEKIQGDNGTINGLNWVSNGWYGNFALDGVGSYNSTELTTLDKFFEALDSDCSILFTIQTTDSESDIMSNEVNPGGNSFFHLATRGFGQTSDGTLSVSLFDDSGDGLVLDSNSRIDDGTKKRLVINKTGNTASDIEIYINGNKDGTVIDIDQSFSNTSTVSKPVYTHARNSGNGINKNINAILDNLIFTNSSLTSSEIQGDYDNQPWS